MRALKNLSAERAIALLVSMPLLILLVIRGIAPAWTGIQTDFPNYYTAGTIAARGENTSRLYDDAWFQDQIHRNGIDQRGKFSPFPPPTALLFVPLSALSPPDALRVCTLVNVLLLALSVWLLTQILSTSWPIALAFALLSGAGLWNCLRFGQLYIALSASVLLGVYFYAANRPILSGVFLGLLIPVKYYPAVLVLHYALVREWKVVIAACATAAIVVAVSIATLGWEVHREFLLNVLGDHLASHFSGQTPYAPAFQSWDSLLRRMFVFDGAQNPQPLIAARGIFVAVKVLILGGLTAGAATILFHLYRTRPPLFAECAIGILGIFPLLVAPGTATYHFVLLWLPCGLLLYTFRAAGSRKPFYAFLALYSLIGFIPYGMFSRLGESAAAGFLAYPRLFALLALFLVAAAGSRTIMNSNAITTDGSGAAL